MKRRLHVQPSLVFVVPEYPEFPESPVFSESPEFPDYFKPDCFLQKSSCALPTGRIDGPE